MVRSVVSLVFFQEAQVQVPLSNLCLSISQFLNNTFTKGQRHKSQRTGKGLLGADESSVHSSFIDADWRTTKRCVTVNAEQCVMIMDNIIDAL